MVYAAVKVAQRKLKAQDSVIARYRAELAQAVVELRRYSLLYSQGATSAEVRDRRITIESVTRANLEQALALVEAGATRLGTSRGVALAQAMRG